MALKTYRRLPGIGRKVFLTTRLWTTPDHLLLVQASGMSESYRRFFFRDIQAITICRTGTGDVVSCVLAAAALVLGVCGVWLGDIARMACWIAAGVLLVPLLWNLFRGPTCRCMIRTPVQTHELSSLHRLRLARRVLARIRPLIEEAQAGAPLTAPNT